MTAEDSSDGKPKTLGQAIDAIVEALRDLDEATKAGAIRASCEHLGIGLPTANTGGTHCADEAPVASRPMTPSDIRSLKTAKNPTSANEMSALVAYYLSEIAAGDEKGVEVAVEDIVKYFKQASSTSEDDTEPAAECKKRWVLRFNGPRSLQA